MTAQGPENDVRKMDGMLGCCLLFRLQGSVCCSHIQFNSLWKPLRLPPPPSATPSRFFFSFAHGIQWMCTINGAISAICARDISTHTRAARCSHQVCLLLFFLFLHLTDHDNSLAKTRRIFAFSLFRFRIVRAVGHSGCVSCILPLVVPSSVKRN